VKAIKRRVHFQRNASERPTRRCRSPRRATRVHTAAAAGTQSSTDTTAPTATTAPAPPSTATARRTGVSTGRGVNGYGWGCRLTTMRWVPLAAYMKSKHPQAAD